MTETDPTGEPCKACGDVPYLSAFLLRVFISGRSSGDQAIYLCESCKEVLDDELCED